MLINSNISSPINIEVQPASGVLPTQLSAVHQGRLVIFNLNFTTTLSLGAITNTIASIDVDFAPYTVIQVPYILWDGASGNIANGSAIIDTYGVVKISNGTTIRPSTNNSFYINAIWFCKTK